MRALLVLSIPRMRHFDGYLWRIWVIVLLYFVCDRFIIFPCMKFFHLYIETVVIHRHVPAVEKFSSC